MCVAGGTRAVISWTFNGALPLPDGVIVFNDRLSIQHVLPAQAGHYECIVSDIVGTTAIVAGTLFVLCEYI